MAMVAGTAVRVEARPLSQRSPVAGVSAVMEVHGDRQNPDRRTPHRSSPTPREPHPEPRSPVTFLPAHRKLPAPPHSASGGILWRYDWPSGD
jgi:hypothetical protein